MPPSAGAGGAPGGSLPDDAAVAIEHMGAGRGESSPRCECGGAFVRLDAQPLETLPARPGDCGAKRCQILRKCQELLYLHSIAACGEAGWLDVRSLLHRASFWLRPLSWLRRLRVWRAA